MFRSGKISLGSPIKYEREHPSTEFLLSLVSDIFAFVGGKGGDNKVLVL